MRPQKRFKALSGCSFEWDWVPGGDDELPGLSSSSAPLSLDPQPGHRPCPRRPIPTIMYYHVSFAPCIPLTLERQASLSCWCFWTARLMASTTLVDTYLLLGCLDAIYPPLPREEAFTHNYVWFFFFFEMSMPLLALSSLWESQFSSRVKAHLECYLAPEDFPKESNPLPLLSVVSVSPLISTQ